MIIKLLLYIVSIIIGWKLVNSEKLGGLGIGMGLIIATSSFMIIW